MKYFSNESKNEIVKAQRLLDELADWVNKRGIDGAVIIIADKLGDCLEHIKSEVINNYGEK